MGYLAILFVFLISFLFGSIPTAFFVVKLITGKDLRKIGSGNIGGTNASRAADNKTQKYLIYFTTAIVDILKGLVPVLIAIFMFKNKDTVLDKDVIYTVTAVLAILGHDTMPFIKNGQGKGVATTFGAFVAITPLPAYAGLATFFLLRLVTPVASRRSIISGVVVSAGIFLMRYPLPLEIGGLISVILVIYTHRENIKRILRGEE